MPSSRGSNGVPAFSTLPPTASSEMTNSGGTRPPIPISVGVIEASCPTVSTIGKLSSVVVRLSSASAPGRNSVTRPLTSTESPTATVGALDVKTKMPSEVDSWLSGSGSCRKKPLFLSPVTMPGTREALSPSYGERCWAPWMSWMRSSRPTVKNENERSAAIASGGSFSSWSVTAAAWTVVVQRSLRTKSSVGSRVKVVPSPLTDSAWSPLRVQESENAPSAAFTGSEKVISTFASSATSASLPAGSVWLTDGAVSASQNLRGLAELRGAGAPVAKSAALSSLSWQPSLRRRSAVVFESPGAGPTPSNSFAVNP